MQTLVSKEVLANCTQQNVVKDATTWKKKDEQTPTNVLANYATKKGRKMTK